MGSAAGVVNNWSCVRAGRGLDIVLPARPCQARARGITCRESVVGPIACKALFALFLGKRMVDEGVPAELALRCEIGNSNCR